MVACFFGKTANMTTVPLEPRMTDSSEWYTTISSENFEKRTREDELLFTMAMPAVSRLESAPI